MTLFNKMRSNKKVVILPAFSSVPKTTRLECAQKCLFTPQCLSFNFCLPNECKLYNFDRFSVQRNSSMLQYSAECNYHRMKRRTAPVCFEGEIQKDIRDDDNADVCHINLKRVDALYDEWKRIVKENDTDFIVMRKRNVVRKPAHGGQKVTKETVSWIKWHKTAVNYSDAIDACEKEGGRIYDAINGSNTQLLFLSQHLDNKTFWLGFTDYEEEGVWMDSTGQQLQTDVLHWAVGQPDGGVGENCLVFDSRSFHLNSKTLSFFQDASCGQVFAFACQIKP